MRLFGLHAAESALANPQRTVVRVLATENAAQKLAALLAKRGLTPEPASPKDLDRLLGADTVHQGVILDVEPLLPLALDDVDAAGLLLVLDQVTDPQNVGAALRSDECAATHFCPPGTTWHTVPSFLRQKPSAERQKYVWL